MKRMGYKRVITCRRVPIQWTADKIAVIRAMAAEGKYYRDIADEFATGEDTIRKIAKRYQIQVRRKMPLPNNRLWTEEEEEIIRQMYFTHTAYEISAKLDRSLQAVYTRAGKLGLEKKWKKENQNEVCGEKGPG